MMILLIQSVIVYSKVIIRQQSMNKIRKINTENYPENFMINAAIHKSPIRRNNIANAIQPSKSPIRTRTPNKNVSPIKINHQLPNNFRYISNVSPLKERKIEVENHMQFSNGKNLKYINNNLMSDRTYETNKKDKFAEFNKKSDRVIQEDNRLFGKLVDKLNSQKKPGPKSNQNSYKTSIFADNSDTKANRTENGGKTDGAFKHLINQVKAGETKSDIKPHMEYSNRSQRAQQNQNLSCLVYRMKGVHQNQPFTAPSSKIARTDSIPFMKKQSSKCEQIKQIQTVPSTLNCVQDDQDDDDYFDTIMQIVSKGQQSSKKGKIIDSVKMSMGVQQSMSMDPFI